MNRSVFRCARCGALNRVASGRAGTPMCGQCKDALDRSGAPQAVSSAMLERVVASSPLPVLVDFWASWCGPCRTAAPIFDEVGRRRAGAIFVLKVDVDAEQSAARRYGVSSIPTFILFEDGREVARRSGVVPRPELERWIDQNVRGAAGAA